MADVKLYHLVESHGSHRPVRIILHDTESHDWKGIRDIVGVAEYWHNSGNGFGAHVIVDAEGNAGWCVSSDRIAWHCARANTGSLGIEQIGFARFSRPMWMGRKKQLDRVAKIIAQWSMEYDIPLKIDVEMGISTHAMQTKYKNVYGGHTDPGFGYPLYYVLFKARQLKRRMQSEKS